MFFTPERLRALSGSHGHDAAEPVATALENLGERFGMVTLLRRAHLAAQLCYESGGFSRLEENLNYAAERIAAVWPRLAPRAHELAHHPELLGNAAYGGRLGNGDETSGDGWRYRGRGLIQLTGRTNYRDVGKALALDLVSDPNQAADPEIAGEIALLFWQSRGCNAAADADDVTRVTRLINGPACEGLNVREALTTRAKTIFI